MRYALGMSVLSRRSRTERTRRANEGALLAATIALLEEGSAFADLGIEQIVRRAGLSRPTFYSYFRDKQELVLRLGETLEHELLAAAEPWFKREDVTARETIVAVHRIFAQHRAALKALTEAATYDPQVAAFWQAFHEHFLPAARERIASGSPALDADALTARAYALVYMTERTLAEHVNRPLVADDALIDQLTWIWERAAGAADA
jgi:AcrR family transcriptional regulator